MKSPKEPYALRFKSWQIITALICACGIYAADYVFKISSGFDHFVIPKKEEIKPNSIVINGFENISEHRIFEKPKTPLDKRILMLGACQVSSLHWFYTPEGFDPSGRSSLPYIMEKEFQKDPATGNLYVYNLGMEGTGYLEALYFLLSVIEQPNIKLVILSISQEGDTHIPDDNNARYAAYARMLPEMENLLNAYHEKYPENQELNDYYEYIKNHPWTVAGRQSKHKKDAVDVHIKEDAGGHNLKTALNRLTAYIEYNRLSLCLKFQSRWLSDNASGILSGMKEWIGISSAVKTGDTNLKPEEWYIENFKPRTYPVHRRTYARYTKRDKMVLRAMAKLLAEKNIDFWIQNPPDLAVRMDSLVNDKWWVPLTESLSDLPNVKTIDMSGYPFENGVDVAGRVAPTYFGSLKTMNAFKPYILEWNKK